MKAMLVELHKFNDIIGDISFVLWKLALPNSHSSYILVLTRSEQN